MHPAEVATLGEWLARIVTYGKSQGTFSLTLALDEAGDWSSAFMFGSEAADSPMVGGVSYGWEKTAVEALRAIAKECGL